MNAGADGASSPPGGRPTLRPAGRAEPFRARPATHAALEAQFTPEGHGGGLNLMAYGRILARRRWIVLVTVATALAAGAAATLLTRPVYTAQTTLQIDRETEKVVSREDQTPADNLGEEFFQTQYGLLKSRALAERVAETMGLAVNEDFIDAMKDRRRGAAPRGSGAKRLRTSIALLRANQDVVPERGSRLVAVTFSSPDPGLSARIANAYADNFIKAALDRRFEATSYARDFLEQRLAQEKARLEESERQLVAYAASQHIVQIAGDGQVGTPNSGQSLPAANLQAYSSALSAARTDRIKAEQRWNQARDASGVGLVEILQSPTIQQLSQEHAKLAAEYQDKLSVFKADYPDMRQLAARLAEVDRQRAAEAANIRQSLRGQYLSALDNERALESQVSIQQGAVLDLRGRSIRYTILQREVDTNRTLYDGLLQRYKEVGLAGGVAANNISIVDQAVAPAKPSRPRPLTNMALALAAGAGLGVFLALLREAMDQAVRSPTDVEAALGLPLLGAIPALKRPVSPEEALADTRSPLSEAYHSLRSALQFSTSSGFPRTLLITSAWPGGGKSTTAAAVAQSVARLGYRVLLVDADLRNPSLHRVMRADTRVGLTNLLTGAVELQGVVQATPFVNLFVVTSGPLPPNPAELLAGERLGSLIAQCALLFDMVIFDGPPIMALADAPMVGAAVEGSLMVVEANRTTRPQVRAAMRRLAIAGAHVLGVVLTRYKPDRGDDLYGYGYDYGHALLETAAVSGADHPVGAA